MAIIKGNYDVFYRLALSNDAPTELMAFRSLLLEAMGRSDISIKEKNGDVVISGPMGKLTGQQILGLATLAVPGVDDRLHISRLPAFAVVPKAKIDDVVPSELPDYMGVAINRTETIIPPDPDLVEFGDDGEPIPQQPTVKVDIEETPTPNTWRTWRDSRHSLTELQDGSFGFMCHPYGRTLDSDILLILAGAGLEILGEVEYKADPRRPSQDGEI